MLRNSLHKSIKRTYCTKYALTCPGQGLIRNGFLAPYSEYQKHFKESLDIINESLNEKFTDNLFNTSSEFAKEWLLKTSNAQPAILSTTYIIHEILKKEFDIDLVKSSSYILGHSLGEYTALLLSGVIDLSTAVELVRKRGQLMEEVIKTDEYGMIVLMFKPTSFDIVLEKAQSVMANINSYQQVVLSGKILEIDEVVKSINSEKRHILRSVKLPVQIPFHSSVLREVEPKLFELVKSQNCPVKPIISNLSGSPMKEYVQNVIAANSRPVQWVKSIEFLISNEITKIINLGPGDVLQGINSKFGVTNLNIDSIESMKAYQESQNL